MCSMCRVSAIEDFLCVPRESEAFIRGFGGRHYARHSFCLTCYGLSPKTAPLGLGEGRRRSTSERVVETIQNQSRRSFEIAKRPEIPPVGVRSGRRT